MKIKYQTLWRIIGTPDAGETALFHRYYCTPMYMNGKCTTHCIKDCGARVKRIHDQSHGEFIINPLGMLVECARTEVANLLEQDAKHQAETPVNALGEHVPTTDPFAKLIKQYETTTTLG